MLLLALPKNEYVRIAIFLLIVFAGVQQRGSAQGLSASYGAMKVISDPQGGGSYAWQIDYRQSVTRHLAWSLMWLNEGHVPGHHRDGFAGQIWGVLPLVDDRLEIAAGVGLYNFFDTKTAHNHEEPEKTTSGDVHNLAAIYSMTATWRVSSRWFLQATINRIAPVGDVNMNTLTYTAGVGYWLGGSRKTASEVADWQPGNRNEITLFAGESVVNIHGGQRTFTGQIEYRRELGAHTDWTIAYLNEGTGKNLKRNGAVTQMWLVARFFEERFQVGFGAGVYWTFESSNEIEGWRALSAIVSPTVAWRFSKHWLARVTWNRVVSSYDRDADNFLVGLGYSWGE